MVGGVLITVFPPKARLNRVMALVSELEASLLFLPQQFTRFITEVSRARNLCKFQGRGALTSLYCTESL